MTVDLASQQLAFLDALARPREGDLPDAQLAPHLLDSPLNARGLDAYRSNAQELAHRALTAAYPVVAQLLGEDNIRGLSWQLWRATPPARGDLAQWGGALANCLEAMPELLAEEPYLPEVARVEWALHQAATTADAATDAASFELLARLDPSCLTLVLSPGAWCRETDWPVVSIIEAHLRSELSVEEAGQRLRDGVRETALVWRRGLRPSLRLALPGEAALIAALKEKVPLPDSLAVAPELDFNAWLPMAIQSGLVVRAAEC